MERGFQVERDIVNIFNLKRFIELDVIHRKMINRMFGEVEDDEFITASLCSSISKPDIYIQVNGVRKYISVKSGSSNSVHSEKLKSLILFLREIGISKKSQIILLKFHYGDGTLDGSGDKRYLCDQLMEIMKKDIEQLNKELNQENIIMKCLERFVFNGISEYCGSVDYIYFVRDKVETLTSKKDLINYVRCKDFNYIKKPHIGPMTIQPYLRDVDRISKHPFKREVVQVKWNGLKFMVGYANYYAHNKKV